MDSCFRSNTLIVPKNQQELAHMGRVSSPHTGLGTAVPMAPMMVTKAENPKTGMYGVMEQRYLVGRKAVYPLAAELHAISWWSYSVTELLPMLNTLLCIG